MSKLKILSMLFLLISSQQAYSYVSATTELIRTSTKLHSLYSLMAKTPKYSTLSQKTYLTMLKTKNVSHFSTYISQLPKSDIYPLLMDVAEHKGLVTELQKLRIGAQYSKLDDGNSLLLKALEFENTQVLVSAPKYGKNLLIVESRSAGSSVKIAQSMGDKGLLIAKDLNELNIGKLSKHAKNIEGLGEAAKVKFIDLLEKSSNAVLNYLEAHPGFVWNAAGVSALIIAVDNITEPKVTKTTLPDGTVIEKSESVVGDGLNGVVEYIKYAFLMIFTLWLVRKFIKGKKSTD